jgi:transcriptional regulator with XRE-family HTH domain
MKRGNELLREAREKCGLTQGQLSYTTGINRASISRWELGKRQIPFDTLVGILDAMGLQVVVLPIDDDLTQKPANKIGCPSDFSADELCDHE